MTPDRRRQQLTSLGYVVMRQPFRSESVFCMKHANHQKGGQLYSIDLANGRWNRWGIDVDGVWHDWEQLVSGEQPCIDSENHAEEPSVHASEGASDPQNGGFDSSIFVEECEAAGFVLEPNHTTTVDFGNRFARFDGRRYLICPQTQQIIDRRFEKHTLAQFRSETGEVCHSTTPAIQGSNDPSGTSEVDRPHSVPPKPFVSMREQPVTVTGRSCQPSLF